MIKMAAIERVYNIPLRKEFQRAPRYKRAKRAVNALRSFLKKHMKSEDVKIGKHLNLKLWEHGIKNPPHHVKINVVKDDKGIVKAELFGKNYEEETEEKKKEGKKEVKKKEEKEGKKERKEGEKQIKEELGKLEEKTKVIEEKDGEKKEGKKALKKKLEKELKEKK
mgnify:CR=1 FL=1|tara:strand:- start:89 stop:586 length:498 start_codon:yes stop_codon:yes gene_type:complete